MEKLCKTNTVCAFDARNLYCQSYSSNRFLISAVDWGAWSPLYPRERDPVPIIQEAGRAPGAVWMYAENLAPTVIRSPDRQTRSEPLHWLSSTGSRTCQSVYVWIRDYVLNAVIMKVAVVEDAALCSGI